MTPRFLLLTLAAVMLTGCVSAPSGLSDPQKNKLRFEYAEIEDVTILRTFDDASKLVRLNLQVGGNRFSCYGRFADAFATDVSSRKVLHKITIKKNGDGFWMVDSIEAGMGIYGGLQYYAAFTWLVGHLSYPLAHIVSLIVPVVLFVIILCLGFVFVEY